jgi:hypothetical protein
MMLHDCLREVLRLLGDIGCDHVTIARAGERAYQVRFEPTRTAANVYTKQVRYWVGSWTPWDHHYGWSVEEVLADDWKIL